MKKIAAIVVLVAMSVTVLVGYTEKNKMLFYKLLYIEEETEEEQGEGQGREQDEEHNREWSKEHDSEQSEEQIKEQSEKQNQEQSEKQNQEQSAKQNQEQSEGQNLNGEVENQSVFSYIDEDTELQQQLDKVWEENGIMDHLMYQRKNAWDLSILGMGQRVEVYKNIGVTIHSAYQLDEKNLLLSEEMRKYYWYGSENCTYVVMDLEIENMDTVERKFQMDCFYTFNDCNGLEQWPIDFSDIAEEAKYDAQHVYLLVLQPGEVVRTTVAIFVPETYVTENHELELIVNPVCREELVGAAKVRLKLDSK